MSRGEAVRVATLLGPNTVEGLERLVDHLQRRGLDATVVAPPDGLADGTPDHDLANGLDPGSDPGPDLLWACGLLTAELVAAGARLDVVAAPLFPGESRAVYHSVIVARPDRLPPGRRLAINEFGSWSGYRALFHDAVVRGDTRWHPDRMDEIVVTGAHVESVAAVADGRADVAAIDSSVWHWLIERDSTARGLTIVDRTADCPAPPFSVGGTMPTGTRAELVDALRAFEGPPRLVPATIDDYRFMIL